MTSKKFELNSICRFCIKLLETEKVAPIFNNENYAACTLPERIHYCSSIKVCEGDGLPAFICSNCLMKLNQSFVFRNQCVLADNTLKRLAKDINFSLDELPNLSEADCESQVIKHDFDAPCELTRVRRKNKSVFHSHEDIGIDEFDNSKNGRHKKNINKTNDRSMHKAKMLNTNCENNTDDEMDAGWLNSSESDSAAPLDDDSDFSLSSPHEDEKIEGNAKENLRKKKSRRNFLKKDIPKKVQNALNSFKKHESKNSDLTKQISRFFELYSEKENRIKTKRIKKVKEKKLADLTEETDDEVEIKEEVIEQVETFTVEPDVFSFDETKKEMDVKKEEDIDDDSKEYRQKSFKRSLREKISGARRGRPRKYPIIKEKPTSYTCDYCQKVYPSEGGWRYHIHTMHNENYQPFICDLCGKAFKVKKNLEGHKNSIHYHLKQHLCDLCGRGFASKYALKVHKIWHNDEKNFPCDICGTKFRTRGKMNTHRSIHGGPKKFMCHVCSRDFRWKKDFEIHMRTHTGEKPFKCSHCGKAFSSLTNMKKHERNHSGKFGIIQAPEMYDIRMNLPGSDERLYKADMAYPFNYTLDDMRNRPGE